MEKYYGRIKECFGNKQFSIHDLAKALKGKSEERLFLELLQKDM
ncbi:MAG: hypothetical protein QME12_03080 [Nanoarchaeota archaeon]|nr:hypothetical protein [Nanoarchaeota archaeon]